MSWSFNRIIIATTAIDRLLLIWMIMSVLHLHLHCYFSELYLRLFQMDDLVSILCHRWIKVSVLGICLIDVLNVPDSLFLFQTWNVGSFANLKYLSVGFCVAKLFSFTTTSNELTQHCDISKIYLLHLDLSKTPSLTEVSRLRTSELNINTLVFRWILKLISFFDDFIKLCLSDTDSKVNLSIISWWFIKSNFIKTK